MYCEPQNLLAGRAHAKCSYHKKPNQPNRKAESKAHEETLGGDVSVCDVDCGDGFRAVCELIKLSTRITCRVLCVGCTSVLGGPSPRVVVAAVTLFYEG